MEDYSTYSYIKLLIDADVFEHRKKSFWDGADVIFVTPQKKEHDIKHIPNAEASYKHWEETGSHTVVVTEYAPAIIALIEELKPIIKVDYLSKYEYYSQIADYVIKHKEEDNVKKLLYGILDLVNKGGWFDQKQYKTIDIDEHRQDKDEKISGIEISEWFKYGVKNNDPFFVKFMALWVAFNKLYESQYNHRKYALQRNGNTFTINTGRTTREIPYEKYDGRIPISYWITNKGYGYTTQRPETSERSLITKFVVYNAEELVSLYDVVFEKGLTKIFEEKPIKNMKDQRQDDHNAIYEDLKRPLENWIKKGVFNSTDKDFCYKFARTLALFQSIYSVRCNLFHGSKSTDNDRDVALIRSSGKLLEIYLNKIITLDTNNL